MRTKCSCYPKELRKITEYASRDGRRHTPTLAATQSWIEGYFGRLSISCRSLPRGTCEPFDADGISRRVGVLLASVPTHTPPHKAFVRLGPRAARATNRRKNNKDLAGRADYPAVRTGEGNNTPNGRRIHFYIYRSRHAPCQVQLNWLSISVSVSHCTVCVFDPNVHIYIAKKSRSESNHARTISAPKTRHAALFSSDDFVALTMQMSLRSPASVPKQSASGTAAIKC